MKRIISLLLCTVIIALSLAACDNDPRNVIEQELQLLQDGKYAESSFADYLILLGDEYSHLADEVYSNMTYTFGNYMERDGKASVQVYITIFDVMEAYTVYAEKLMEKLSSGELETDTMLAFQEELFTFEGIEPLYADFIVVVEKTNNGWAINKEENDDLIYVLNCGIE